MYHTSIQSHVQVPPVLACDFGQGMRRLLPLQQHSYQPRQLLQRTKEFFEREELLDKRQTDARFDFVHAFKTGRPQFGFNPSESQLRLLMRFLDIFFFSGLLAAGEDPIVRLEFGEDIFDQIRIPGEVGRFTLGCTEGKVDDEDTLRLSIRVEACDPWSKEGHIARRDLISLLETLVHEMAHAYFMYFACPCGLCQREMGATGHGPEWQELKQAMYMTIRCWDLSLGCLYMDDEDCLDEM